MKKLIFSTVVGVFAVASVAAASSLTQSQMDAIISMLHAFNVEESVIANVRTSLTGGGSTTPPAQWCHTFNVNLKVGDKGAEVTALQTALTNAGFGPNEGFQLDTEASGGLKGGSEFGEQTASAVTTFQEKYKSEILTPVGLAHGTGYVGPSTRKKLNQLYGCGSLLPRPYPSPVACTQEAKQCPDGSYVSRTEPKCEFAACPISNNQPTIKVLSPNGGEQWKIGSKQTITWKPYSVSISEVPPQVGRVTITLDSGIRCFTTPCPSGYILASEVRDSGFFDWTVGEDITGSSIPNGSYKVIVTHTYNTYPDSIPDSSDAPFSIVAAQ